MPSPTKPTTNLTREELRKEIGELFDAGSNLKARAGGTIEAEFQYKKFCVDRFEAILDTYTQAKEREARIDGANVLKSRMIKHFTAWGGSQGNCVPQDTLEDYIDALKADKENL